MRGRLADLQARQVEVGRIRLGTTETKTSSQGREYQSPVKLERFRLTSRSQQLIEEAAGLYGGQVEPWTPQNGGAQQFEVVVESRSLPIIVPPDPLSQYYEVWAGGKIQRRCDGQRELLGDQGCLCAAADPDPARRQCKPYTRLSVMLAEMNGVGVWRLETHGYNAAVELPAVADLLSKAGGNVPARLEMEERSAIVEVKGKDTTTRFMVPVIHVELSPAAIVGSFQPRQAIEAPTSEAPALDAGPADPTPVGPVTLPPGGRQAIIEEAQTWVVGVLDAIAQATDRDQMMQIRTEFLAAKWPDEMKPPLVEAWNARAKELVAAARQAPPQQNQGASAAAAPATPASTPTLDKGQVWLAIQRWAGFKNLGTSQVTARFKAWGKGGDDFRLADAQTLEQFRVWLEGNA